MEDPNSFDLKQSFDESSSTTKEIDNSISLLIGHDQDAGTLSKHEPSESKLCRICGQACSNIIELFGFESKSSNILENVTCVFQCW